MTGQGRYEALEWFLRTDPADAGCEHALDLLHAYAELAAAGRDPETRYPGITAHLRSCSPCAEDLEGLLAILRAEDVPPGCR